MNQQQALNRLYWKEAMQTLPLVFVLLAIGFFAHIILLFEKQQYGHIVAFLSIPILFAIGIGALLIGQERESRTLRWLQTLPIEPRHVLRSKLVAGVGSLAFIWIASGLMYVLFGWLHGDELVARIRTTPLTTMVLRFLALQSLFILLVGIYLSWQFRSSLLALFLLVPICVIPPFMVQTAIGESAWERGAPWLTGLLACGSAVALWAGWRAGIRCLGSEKTTASYRQKTFDVSVEVDAATKASWLVPHRSANALLWQFLHHNRIVLATSTLMMLAGLALAPTLTTGGIQMAILLGIIGASWLSAAVFAGDAWHGSARFLAERGIRAPATWITRQAIPITILGSISLLYIAVSTGVENLPDVTSDWRLLAGLATLWFTFVSCQWLGQMLNSPIVAAILAPACAALAVSAAGIAIFTVGTPIWVVLLVSFVPLLATFGLTRRWMDQRTGVTYWSIHAACLVLCLAAPFLSLLSAYQSSSMPRQTRNEFADELRYGLEGSPADFRSLLPDKFPTLGMIEMSSPDMAASRSRDLKSKTDLLRAEAMTSRWANESDRAVATYQRCVADMARAAIHFRSSAVLANQDAADLAEIWLLQEMRRSDAKANIGVEWYDIIANVLAADELRSSLRKRAVVESWRQWKEQDSVLEVGGHFLDNKIPMSTWRDQIIAKNRIEQAFAQLWTLAKGSSETPHDSVASVAKALGFAPQSYSDRLADVATSPTNTHSLPGRWWGGDWEQQAKQLRSAIRESSEVSDDHE